jgi:hypothetical protein
LKLLLHSEKQTAKSSSAKLKKRESSLQSLEAYEVVERASEADLDAAETVLAGMLVDQWLRTQGESMTEDSVGQPGPSDGDLRNDKNAA